MFLDQGMQLAGLLSLSDLSEIVDPQAGLLREAFVVPGDIVWTHVAAAMAARVPTEDDVPAESLRRLLEELGHQGVAAVDIPTRLTEAFAAMKAAAAQPAERSNVGMDIDATIAKARERLDALDPQGALAVLDGKQAEVAELRTDATQREIALLAEKAKIQRLSLDHKAALATLGGIVELDAENDWALIETGDIHLLLGRSSDAKSAFERAFAIARNQDGKRRISVALDRIGDVRSAEGDRAGALDAYGKGLVIREDLARRDPGNMVWQRDLSVSHERIGDVRSAEGDRAGALDAYGKGLVIREDLACRDPGNMGWQRDLSVSHERIGDVRSAEGDRAGALDAYGKGLALREDLACRDPGNMDWQRDLSVSHDRIGDVRSAEGDRAGALDAYGKGLAIAEDLARRDPGNMVWQRDLSISHNKIGDVRSAEGDRAGALDAYGKGLAIAEDLARRDPGNMVWQRDLSVSHNKIGDVRSDEGHRADALNAYGKGLAIAEDLARRDPGNATWQCDLAVSLSRLADLGDAQGATWARVVAIYEELDTTGRLAPPERVWLDEARRRCDATGRG